MDGSNWTGRRAVKDWTRRGGWQVGGKTRRKMMDRWGEGGRVGMEDWFMRRGVSLRSI